MHLITHKGEINQPQIIRCLLEYFAYYLNIPTDLNDCTSLGDVYEHEKSMDFETIQSKYSRNENSYECTVNKTEEYPLRSRANHSAADFFVTFFVTTQKLIINLLQFCSMCTIIVMVIFRIMNFWRAKDDRR